MVCCEHLNVQNLTTPPQIADSWCILPSSSATCDALEADTDAAADDAAADEAAVGDAEVFKGKIHHTMHGRSTTLFLPKQGNSDVTCHAKQHCYF